MRLKTSFLWYPVILLMASACAPTALRRRTPEMAKHLSASSAEIANLSDREYLMRKATLGSRAERLGALDVIETAQDAGMFEFLVERLKKEDDRFLQIRIMQILASGGDVRAVPPLRYFARWDETRVGVEAIAALYDLGDDSFMPRLILKLRPNEDFPEMPGIAHRALKKMTGEDFPASTQAWLNYYRSHRLAPYQTRAWWPLQAPLPPTVAGTTKVIPHKKGQVPLPEQDVRLRHTNISWFEFWKPDQP